MTEVFEKPILDEQGRILKVDHVQAFHLRPNSDEIVPGGCPQGSEAYVVDTGDVAFYSTKLGLWRTMDGRTVAPGQTWADLS